MELWTNRGARISSYQILMSVVVIMLIAEHFWTVQNFLRLARLIFNRNHRIRSDCIVAKRHTAHLIMLPNYGDLVGLGQGKTHALFRCAAIWYDLLRSVMLFRGPLLNACYE